MAKFILVLFVALFALAMSEDPKEKATKVFKKALKECQADPATQVDKEVIAKIHKGEWPDDKQLKEGIYCFAKKVGFQDENGVVQEEHVKAKLALVYTGDAYNKVTACIVQKATPQETAYEFWKCKQQVVGLDNNVLTTA